MIDKLFADIQTNYEAALYRRSLIEKGITKEKDLRFYCRREGLHFVDVKQRIARAKQWLLTHHTDDPDIAKQAAILKLFHDLRIIRYCIDVKIGKAPMTNNPELVDLVQTIGDLLVEPIVSEDDSDDLPF